MEDKESFYKKLKIQLDQTTRFPSDYMYKFIVPSDGDQLNQIQSIFNQKNAIISKRKSVSFNPSKKISRYLNNLS